jgi:cytochrome b6-f complex iron-sulfur subunit
MDKREFLEKLGLAGGALIVTACLGACSKSSDSTEPNPPAPTVDFTFDKTLPEYAILSTNGNYIYTNGVVVARTVAGNLIAVSSRCTHSGNDVNVQYQSNGDRFWCPNHGAIFGITGNAVSGPTNGNLKEYAVTITGNMVRING